MRVPAVLLAVSLLGCGPKQAPEVATPAVPSVTKAPLDARDYGYVQLPNGLRAIVISDPETDLAAASLDVHIGHYADPLDRQGLAHFLEHMLFMGTDRYPGVDDYRKFVEDHGGGTNAGTGGEHTQYFFRIEADSLEPALDRFARFFVAPLLTPDHVERERKAVHSEYSLKLKDHARRIRQVRKITTHPEHPESKFSVGNHDTLGDRESSTVHADLLALYRQNYLPDRMTVSVIGRESVDTLKGWVVEKFSEVSGDPADKPARPAPFRDDQLGVRIDLVPLDERRELELQFPLPPQQPIWPAKPLSLITNLLSHQGEGTLFAALKSAGWIEWLRAGNEGADDYDQLTVRVGLTEAGAEQIEPIVAAVFQAFALIESDGLEAFRQDEMRTVAELGFRFSEASKASGAVRSVARTLQYHPPARVLDHWSHYAPFDPAPVRERLALLTPDNARLLVTLPGLETDQVEPLYDVAYGIRPLTTEEKASFQAGNSLAMALPPPNPYLPEAVALKVGGDAPGIPELLDSASELWHLHDTSFGVPRAMSTVQLWSAVGRADLRAAVLMELFERVLEDSLQEVSYPLGQAGLGFSFAGDDEGLQLQVWGYDDRQERLLRDLCVAVRELQVDPARFAILRDKLVRAWRNRKQDRPISQTRSAAAEALSPYDFDNDAAIPVAEALTAGDLQSFVGAFGESLSARILVHGNQTAAEAQAFEAIVREELIRDAGPSGPIETVRRRIPAGAQLVRDVEIDHHDSTLLVVYQGPTDDLVEHARWSMLAELLDTPFFGQLRTEQQLGYVVGSWYSTFDRLPGLKLNIQSPVAGPVTLLERVDSFLASHAEVVAAMPEEEFATIRAGLVTDLLEKDTQLYQRSGSLRSDLYRGVTSFDSAEQRAALVGALTRDEMAAFYREVLGEGAGRLIVRSFGNAHAEEAAAATPGCADTSCVVSQLGEPYRRTLFTP